MAKVKLFIQKNFFPNSGRFYVGAACNIQPPKIRSPRLAGGFFLCTMILPGYPSAAAAVVSAAAVVAAAVVSAAPGIAAAVAAAAAGEQDDNQDDDPQAASAAPAVVIAAPHNEVPPTR